MRLHAHASRSAATASGRSSFVPSHAMTRPCSAPLLAKEHCGGRRDVSAASRRRSPVIMPDITIGKGEQEQGIDLYSYLLRQRIVFVSGYMNDKLASQVVGSLLALEAVDETQDIRLYLNCSGGQPYSVFGVLDTMAALKPDIQTYGLGACYSYASLILGAGTKGKRHAMKNTRIMMSQPMGGSQGDMYAIEKTVEELNAIYQMVARYYMGYTSMNQDQIEKATVRDNFMTPEEAQLAGLIDHVVGGEGDKYVPYSVTRRFKEAGLIDDLSSGLLL